MSLKRSLGVHASAQHGWLSQLSIGWKTALLVVYIAAILYTREAFALAIFALAVWLLAWRLGLSGLGRNTLLLIGVTLLVQIIHLSLLNFLFLLLFALLRVSLISKFIHWYAETIPYAHLFAWMQHSRGRTQREILFFIVSNLTLFPLIERDLTLALDAERIRLGHMPRVWMLGTWLNVLINVLVRGLERANATAQSAVERGFALDATFTAAPEASITAPRLITVFAAFLPALTLLGVELWL